METYMYHRVHHTLHTCLCTVYNPRHEGNGTISNYVPMNNMLLQLRRPSVYHTAYIGIVLFTAYQTKHTAANKCLT